MEKGATEKDNKTNQALFDIIVNNSQDKYINDQKSLREQVQLQLDLINKKIVKTNQDY